MPPGQCRPADMRVVSKLMPAECRRLIAPGGVGRIAFGTISGPVVVPVNFAVLADTMVIRTAEGTVIDGHADEQVALEVDHIDEALCQGWSVLVRGPAHRVAHPAELRRLQEDAAVWPWPGGEREVYVRIVPREITGRRIELRPAPVHRTRNAGPPGSGAGARSVSSATGGRPPGRPGRPAGRCNPTRCRTSRTP